MTKKFIHTFLLLWQTFKSTASTVTVLSLVNSREKEKKINQRLRNGTFSTLSKKSFAHEFIFAQHQAVYRMPLMLSVALTGDTTSQCVCYLSWMQFSKASLERTLRAHLCTKLFQEEWWFCWILWTRCFKQYTLLSFRRFF